MSPTQDFISRMTQSFAISSLAAAIAYFSYSLVQIKEDIPMIIEAVDSMNAKGDTLATNIPLLLDKLEQGKVSIDGLSTSISEARKTAENFEAIGLGLNYELTQYRNNTIPDIKASVDNFTMSHTNMNTTLGDINTQVPTILSTVNTFDATLNRGITAMYNVQPSVDNLTDEMTKVRNEFPVMVEDAKEVVDAANRVGSKTSEGVVDGIIKGVITSPITVLKGAGESLTELLGLDRRLSESEQRDIWKSIEMSVISSDTIHWESDRSKNSATISPGKAYERYDRDCRLVNLTLKFANEETSTQSHEICKVNGQWMRITKR